MNGIERAGCYGLDGVGGRERRGWSECCSTTLMISCLLACLIRSYTNLPRRPRVGPCGKLSRDGFHSNICFPAYKRFAGGVWMEAVCKVGHTRARFIGT